MSIPSLQRQTPASIASEQAVRKTSPTAPGNGFAELLGATSAGKPASITSESALAAAEVLRLEMMRSAIAINDPGQHPSSQIGTQGLSTLLAAFRDNSQKIVTTHPLDTLPPAAVESVPSPTEWTTSTPAPIAEIVQRASRRYGVDEGLIKAIIKAESNFNPRAVSSAGAQGLMQLMPATARGLGVTDSFNPEQNIMAGTRFLKDMLNRYKGNLEEALAAYNWGPGNVDRKGLVVPRETRNYIARVKGYFNQYAA